MSGEVIDHDQADNVLLLPSLAVEYLFLTNNGNMDTQEAVFEPFNARTALNDYEVCKPTRKIYFATFIFRFNRFHGLCAI